MKKLNFLILIGILALTGCATAPEQTTAQKTTACTKEQTVVDGALKAMMIMQGYAFEGGC